MKIIKSLDSKQNDVIWISEEYINGIVLSKAEETSRAVLSCRMRPGK